MSAAVSALATRLADIVGNSHIVASPDELASYAIDALRPSAAVRPGSAQEAAEAIKFAAAEKLGVVPCGARTKVDIGWPPRKYDLAIDMTGLDRVVAYDPDDLTLSVEAGIPLRKVSSVLAERGQFLPLEIPFFGRATVGGTVASGMDSPLRQFYGTARDFILGMEFITGDGALAKSGGRVVKNVTGYDLHKLMAGAFGTLGVITCINFRTFPLPRGARAFVANFESAERALDLRGRVSRSPLKPLTVEIFSPGAADIFYGDAAARMASDALARNLLTNNTWAFSCGFAGTDKVLERYEGELVRMAEQAGAAHTTILRGDEVRGAFGRKREFVAIALESSPAAVVIKASVMPSRISEVLGEIESGSATESIRCATMARGVGVIYAALLCDGTTGDVRDRAGRMAARIQGACDKAGGHATIPWCPSAWKSSLKIWGAERGDFAQMRKLKAVFDPRGILSPGRFVGEL
jgi:glycolate oxidase FAD binding subunit